ncbi:Xylose operon regulatory protein [Polystyrenella longa]|uniref:Xylose operon regulatory protein n=1 Tax=Polystyrenella longa TaxID=2528007 RepID=A0A518CPW5_9PLAN|nr:DNA-binding transcriptional regulator [Polystyrenella longa]QDU81263.1 Xylose operon regulatory protein [Polystyrenella longa]
MSSIPHVALLIETTRSYTREILQGVKRYVSEQSPWSVFVELRALDSPPPPWLKNWSGDGILTRTGSQKMADAIRQTGVPAVELRSTRLRHDFPFIGMDNQSIGRQVAQHFLERGFRNFGIYDFDTEDFFEERRDTFQQILKEEQIECSTFSSRHKKESPPEWEAHQRALSAWLLELPKPVGILACTDQLGFWLLDACQRAGLSVPEEVAVVGVENDETLCGMATPPLSSLKMNGLKVGYEAAALLNRLMKGDSEPQGPLLVEPVGIVTRQSSDIVAIDDQDLARALRLIREKACEGITVSEVLKVVPISRSSLERRMRDLLGRSPNAEINRVRLNQARLLLTETDLSLAEIARRTGFQYQQYLSELFHKTYEQTPSQFRSEQRRG